eukprot:5064225-Amphidinium_carterae.1
MTPGSSDSPLAPQAFSDGDYGDLCQSAVVASAAGCAGAPCGSLLELESAQSHKVMFRGMQFDVRVEAATVEVLGHGRAQTRTCSTLEALAFPSDSGNVNLT